MDGMSKHGRVIPTNFGLKYNPPKLGIQYFFKDNPKATFVHEVLIENVDDKKPEELINDLFTKHKKFVDPKVVSRNQLENLMERLKSNLSKQAMAKNKENIKENPINNNVAKTGKGDPWSLDKDVDENKDESMTRPQNFEKDIFSGANKDEFKSNDKEFMLDDFDIDNDNDNDQEDHDEDQKINDGQDMFEGLHEDELSPSATKSPETKTELEATPAAEEGDDDDSDAIDIDNEDELAARGLKKIQIEGEEEEFLMDAEGNIYNLNGDFIGTTNGDAEEEAEEDF